MTRAAFRQADIERIIRAAKAVDAVVQIDLRTLVVAILFDDAFYTAITSRGNRTTTAAPLLPLGSSWRSI